MKKAIVVYDTRFGNTREIAHALAKGMDRQGIKVDCLEVDKLNMSKLDDYDLVAIGGPTHMLGVSKGMKEFLEQLRSYYKNRKWGFCFDTRVHSRLNRFDLNSAARRIEKTMKRKGFDLIYPRKSAFVLGREGPLENGAIEAFGKTGMKIAEKCLADVCDL